MRTNLLLSSILSGSLLCGCGGGSAKSSCQSIGPDTNDAVVVGSVDNLQAAADGNLSTFATVDSQASGSYISSKGHQFPGGSSAGVFITPPSGTTAADLTVSTFIDQEQATVESATGPTLTLTPTHGDPATEYASFRTTAPFNGVKLTINRPGDVQLLVYEICGAAAVQ